MADHAEEQAMEAEALAAIFDSQFEVVSSEPPLQWCISLYPEVAAVESPEEFDALNHVGCKLMVTLPPEYPEEGHLPQVDIAIVKGLTESHANTLKELAMEEAQANEGTPSVFALSSTISEWLRDNNRKGLDDESLHAQLMRKQLEKQKQVVQQQKSDTIFESQRQEEVMTEAEREELAVRKRRAEGTPCNKENFDAWQSRFYEEMKWKEESENNATNAEAGKQKKGSGGGGTSKADEDKSGRLTGFQHFSGKATNLEALEAAALEAEQQENEEELDNLVDGVDEELFDVDDDDLDDLDFDDDEDDDEDQVDI